MVEFHGEVTNINIRDGNKFIAFRVTTDDEVEYFVFYSGYLPIQGGDRVHIVGKEANHPDYGKIIKPVRRPLIVLPSVSEYIVDCFIRSKACTQLPALKLYNELERRHENANGVDDYLSRISSSGKEMGFCLPTLDPWKTTKLLGWWSRNISKRRLYLLGLNNGEIESSGLSPDLLYRELLDSPIKVVTISMRKAMDICGMLGRTYNDNDIECGNLIRFIYKNCETKGWTGTPISIIKSKFKYDTIKDEIKDDYGIITYDGLVYFKYQYNAELEAVKFFDTLIMDTLRKRQMSSEEYPYRQYNLKLSNDQKNTVRGCLENSISIITGGAGTGKTSCIREIVLNLELGEKDYRVCAFAGKAVGRVIEVLTVGCPNRKKKCYTLDRLMAQLDLAPVIIIDEASMVTVEKIYKLVMCYRSRNKVLEKLILVGDRNQLPPISWGAMFSGLIASERVPVYRLEYNYRIEKARHLASLGEDAKGDDRIYVRGILENANMLIDPNRDLKKPMKMEESDGFFLIPTSEIIKVKKVLKAIKKYNVSPADISVVAPYRKDVPIINKFFQEVFHEGKSGQEDRRGNIWIKGDRVMQLKNNYEINVYNGSEGYVSRLNDMSISVTFDNETFPYLITDKESDEKGLNISQITHSYAKTVHKAQGSEYRFLIVFISYDSCLATINLLYTAITRAKMKVWLIVDPKVLAKITMRTLPKRHERLKERLISMRQSEEDEIYDLCKYKRVIGDSDEGVAECGDEILGDYDEDFGGGGFDDYDSIMKEYTS